MSSRISYDVSIWEEIRSIVSWKTARLVENINTEISKDSLLAEFQGKHPVPFQLREIMEQRANAWVQRLYDACCDAYKSGGKPLSAEFDRAVWFYRLEPFIMGETDSQIHSGTMGGFLNLLLCAVGSTPEKRPSLTVSQKQCCFDVRMKIYETWYDKLHHLTPSIKEAIRVMSAAKAIERRAARIARGLPPDDPPPPSAIPVHRLNQPEEPQVPTAFNSDPSPSTTRKKFPSPLPSATITGADINEFVAWDGEQYVLRPTKESVLADEGLKLIGSVRELSRIRRFSPGYVFVQNPSQEAPCADCKLQDPPQPPTQVPSLSQPIAPTPPHASPASSAPLGSLSAGADEPVTPVWSSAPEPVLPLLSPAQECPEREALGVSRADMPTHPRAEAATWDTIEISFLSDERVQIRHGVTSETRNYAEFGFADGRSGKPNQAWVTLRALAEQGGIIRDTAKTGRTWPKVEKRMQEIRRVFRKHFGISADPIPFVEGTGYEAHFKINCRSSYHT